MKSAFVKFKHFASRSHVDSNRRPLDYSLLISVLVLCIVGLLVQFSANGGDSDNFVRQGIRIAIALTVMITLAYVPLEKTLKFTPHIYVIGLVLLVLVLLIGLAGRGAQRWLSLGFATFQPAELMKLAVPLIIAWLLSHKYQNDRPFLILMACSISVLLPAYLVYQQPDLGTAIMVVAVGGFAIFLGGLAWRWIGILSFIVVMTVPLIWPFLHDYQKTRVITLFNPWKDPFGQGYHSIQSMIAIGSGGVYGKGWLNGSQSQLEFLPERTTDFVFSVFAEEFGFIGSLLLIFLFLFLIFRCFIIAYKCETEYARIIAGSVAITIFVHLFVNIGMVAGMLPVVGLPLPILSYGGTSMVTVVGGLGLVMAAKHTQKGPYL